MNKIPTDYIQRCYAGWLGKVIGVRHGAPIEGWSYEKIRKLLGEITDYPAAYLNFAADDDTNGPLFFLQALNDYTCTREITAEQIGWTWLNYAPYEHGFYWWGGYGKSTEHTAYLNLQAGIPAPRSGSVAQNGAAVAEQIGGQIFIDAWGLAIPGDPALAAEYAGKAASVGHGGNGVYGGQFVAAAISAAFTQRGIRPVLETALTVIPADCAYAAMVRDIMAYHDANQDADWREGMEYILANWGYDRYPGACHIIPNSAVMVLAMLYGRGDFSRTLNICNMCGWDTDCNAGNVGAIMGVLVGLEGIAAHWRKPINDFLAASSVVGCRNIMNLPQCVRVIADLGYRIRQEQPPEQWRRFLSGAASFDFALPGSTCAFRVRGNETWDYVAHEEAVCRQAPGALRAVFTRVQPGDDRYVYHRTYYRPADFNDSRYDPAFSPILYPGQTITAWVRGGEGAALRVCLYAWEGNERRELTGEAVTLSRDEWTQLVWRIPPMAGACIEQAGVKATALEGAGGEAMLYLDEMHFGGKADYTLDFSKERMEVWNALHREVSQMTVYKGIWDLEGSRLMGACADIGEAYTGDTAWRDVEIACRWQPDLSRGATGFTFRTQGAIRGYALLADAQGLRLLKNANGYRELARVAAQHREGQALEYTVRCEKNTLTLLREGQVLLTFEDAEQPYLNGMAGLSVQRGGHALYEWLRVREL